MSTRKSPQGTVSESAPTFATPTQLKKRWECSAMKLRRWMRSGKLPYHVFGRHIRIAWKDIERIEAASRVEVPQIS